jgi:Asp-tRNAAsn/Glu-tRNAGln amidotransferase A subunit and related amidases
MNSLESLNSRYRVFITLHEIPPIRDGELNGLTFGVKDVILTERVKTTAGSKILADFVPSESAHIVRAILERGGKILGKTNTHEFAVGATNTSSIIGPCANPLDPERICGGSSGGSAAAVALSLVDVGIGTDTGGSVRIPAALCGVVGFKPTTGLISTEGIIPFSWTLDTIGFLTRDVETMKRVTRSLIPAETQTRGSRRPKIGVVLFGEDRVSKEVLKALYGISSQLDLIEVSFGDLESRIRSARRVIAVSEGATYHAKWLSERPNDYFRDVREVLESGLKVTATQYISSVKEATYAKTDSGK